MLYILPHFLPLQFNSCATHSPNGKCESKCFSQKLRQLKADVPIGLLTSGLLAFDGAL